MILLSSTILLTLFYITISIFEAMYFDYRNRLPQYLRHKHEHIYLTAIRIPVWVLYGLLTTWYWGVGMILIFPFIHDGVYYMMRNKITSGIYPKGFFDYSKTDTAWMSLNFKRRVSLAVVGILVILFAKQI